MRGNRVGLVAVERIVDGGGGLHVTKPREVLAGLLADARRRETAGEIDLSTPDGGLAGALPGLLITEAVVTELHGALATMASKAPSGDDLTIVVARAGMCLVSAA